MTTLRWHSRKVLFARDFRYFTMFGSPSLYMRWRYSVCGLSMCVSVRPWWYTKSVLTGSRYLSLQPLVEFHQIYNPQVQLGINTNWFVLKWKVTVQDQSEVLRRRNSLPTNVRRRTLSCLTIYFVFESWVCACFTQQLAAVIMRRMLTVAGHDDHFAITTWNYYVTSMV